MLPRLEAGFLNRSLGCITTLVPLRIMTLAFIPGRKGISVNIFWKLYKSSLLPGEIDFQSTKSESYLDPISLFPIKNALCKLKSCHVVEPEGLCVIFWPNICILCRSISNHMWRRRTKGDLHIQLLPSFGDFQDKYSLSSLHLSFEVRISHTGQSEKT